MEEDMLVKKKKRNRFGNYNKHTTLMFTLGLLLVLVGFSYAFFVYNKTGLYTHTISGGKMSIIYDELAGNNITLSNSYPLTDKEAETKALGFEFTIIGYNESEKNIYYAIEMDYGNDVDGLNRFLDTNLKLSLLENDEIVLENQVFNNLDNQDIYYGNIGMGTSKDSPVTKNYKLRIWISEYVIISDTISDDLSTWTDFEWDFLEEYNKKVYNAMMNNDSQDLSDFGMSIYTTEEFQKMYASFKVNVTADLTYDEVGFVTYDANGGSFTPPKTSLTTNMVTLEKPVMENKGFLGWSSTPNGEVEYYSGDPYNGEYDVLYAIYSDTRNVMVEYWPEEVISVMDELYANNIIANIIFINETEEEIERRATASGETLDITKDNQGKVTLWVEQGENDSLIFYIGSEGTTYLSSGRALFSYSTAEYIDLSNVDTSMVTDMSSMFGVYISENITTYGPQLLKEVDVSHFNTSNVTDMSGMFFTFLSGNKLTSLNVSNWDTSNVENMSFMFAGCFLLTQLDVSNFDTSRVKDMSYMFGFDSDGFYLDRLTFGMKNLLELDVSGFDTSNVENMSNMFASCSSLKYLDVSKFNTSKVTNISNMFSNCKSITELDVSNFDTKNVINMSGLFIWCNSLNYVDLTNFNTSNVTNMSDMFAYCNASFDLTSFNTTKVTNMSQMFYCNSFVKELDLSHFDTSNVISMFDMFCMCRNLISLNVDNWNTSNVTNMSAMFNGCEKISDLYVEHFDTSNVTNMSGMFQRCSQLTSLDLSNFDTSNVSDMRYMFQECVNLTTIYANSDWNTGIVTLSSNMFYSCTSLVGAVAYDSSKNDITMANPTTGYFTRKNA